MSRLDAYWFWSGLPTEAEMRAQLAGFRAQGFGTIYIQARLSMPRALYLSPEYLAAYAQAVRIMAGLGLRAGLYDDYAWTSGQAGGRTVEGADHLRETHLFWAESTGRDAAIAGVRATLGASLGAAVRHWIHEGSAPRLADWAPVAAVLWSADGSVLDVSDAVRIVAAGADGMTARLDLPLPEGARWTLFARARVANSRVINYLLPEAGARFVEQGLEPYARALAGLMPDPVHCLFFDQPAPVLYDWEGRAGNLGNSLLWSDGFAASLVARGPLALQLAALLRDLPGARATRSHVYRAYSALFQQSFFGPLRAFCDRNGLALTGHEILPHVASFALNGGFSSIDPRAALAADFFGTDRWRDATAVDANNLDAQLAPLLGDSIARASGRRGCWCELYVTATRSETRAAGQWEMTPQALRAQLIRLHMLGASRVILHALFASEGDATPSALDNLRFDFAPGYNLQPWWPVMGALAAEAEALAQFIEGAAPPLRIALLYPYETALTEGPRHAHAQTFGHWAERLVALGHPPLVVDEDGLSAMDDARRIHGEAVAALVLPEVVALHDPEVLARAEALGLPVWRGMPDGQDISDALRDLPQISERTGLRNLVAGRDAEGWWRVVLFNEGDTPLVAELSLGAGLVCEPGPPEPAHRLSLALDPQELRLLRLREAGAVTDMTRQPKPGLVPVMELRDGWTLTTSGAARDISVTEGWQAQGDASYSGVGRYSCSFNLTEPMALTLELPGLACAAHVRLDGAEMGAVHHAPFRLPLGTVAAGQHALEIEVMNTAANRFYAGTPFAGALWPDASGLTRPPRLLRKD